ncbi:MAG TPA: DUF2723 domain-containing protein [Longimicrobiales bacterium]
MNQTVKTVRAREAAPASLDAGDARPPYGWAAVAGLAVFVLYAGTLAPTTQFWDTSEYIATAHILGIPHPPGNPLFVVLARAWELLLAPTGLSVAVRINLFSAAMSAAAHAFWFLLAHRILGFYSANGRFRLIGAAVAVLLSATAFTVWNQSNVNEKVYTVSLFTIALLSWLAFRWRDRLGQGKDDNLLLLMVFILALSVGNHLMAFLAAPALVLFILMVNPKALMNWRFYALGAAVAVVGLSIHLFLPLRASLDPVINEADPSTWQSLWDSLARKQYDKPSMFLSPIDRQMPRSIGLLMAQIGNYLQYFDWQWARSVAGNASLFGGARPLFTLLFTFLGVFGAWTHYKKDRPSWVYVAVLFATLSLGLTFYLNFKYGYTWRRDLYPNMDWHEVRERDYFFIVGFSVWGVWAGIGLAALWRRLAEWVGEARAALAPRRYAVASPVLALAFLPLFLNWSWASRAHDYAARDWAYNLLQSVEPYGVLITNGDNDTFPLWYLQEVEGIRQDVTVIVMSYLNTPWYAKQIKQLTTPCPAGVSAADDPTRILCQRPFEPDEAPAFYSAEPRPADRAGESVETPVALNRPPTRSIIQMSDEEIDQVAASFTANPSSFYLSEPLEVQADRLTFTVPAERLLSPAEVFLLHIVQTAMGDRPVYFASTTQAYDAVGLGPHLIRQGVALKLSNGPVGEDPARGIYRMPGDMALALGPYMDLPRTDSLLWNVFVHRGGIPDEWDHWVDYATQGIPFYYAYTHLGAGQVHAMLGDTVQANRHMERVEAWAALGQR